MAFPRCDAAAGRPGGHGQFSCLGRSCITPRKAINQWHNGFASPLDDDELLVRASAVLKSQGPENWSRGRPPGFASPLGSFWLAISEAGWTSRKKVPLGAKLESTRPNYMRVLSNPIPPEAGQKRKTTNARFCCCCQPRCLGGEFTRSRRPVHPYERTSPAAWA